MIRSRLASAGRLVLLVGVLLMLARVSQGQDSTTPQSLRIAEDDNVVALEIASRKYVREDGVRPEVTLVGVAHIGDPGFYDDVQALLENFDVVLYESVMPAGARGARGETDEERVESTRAMLQLLAGVAQTHRATNGGYPADMEALQAYAASVDDRLGNWLSSAQTDGWGAPVQYVLDEAGGSLAISSPGADGAPGGEGAAADIRVDASQAPVFAGIGDDGIQGELARALGLAFQLNDLDYSADNWICSDMTMEGVNRALRERGVDGLAVDDMLGGTTLSGKIAKFLLRGLRVLDSFFDGAITDTVKIMLIEMLGDESITEVALQQYSEGFAEVIVDLRNQVVVDDLAALIEQRPDVNNVAILYGAAHMPDLAERLADQLGYQPGDAQWLRAIEVDMNESAASPQQINDMRRMMRQMMRMQLR